jgi:hypothetical protein
MLSLIRKRCRRTFSAFGTLLRAELDFVYCL